MFKTYHATKSVFITVIFLFFSSVVSAGSEKLMAIKAAKITAERGIMESLAGLKIRAKGQFEDQFNHNISLDSKSAALVKGVEYIKIVYDKEKGIAEVTAELKAHQIKTVLGDTVDYKGKAISRVGFGASNSKAAQPLLALRAAELDAYQEMAKVIVGAEMTSKTSVKNFITTSDDIRIELMAAIYGSDVVAYGWDGEDAYMTIQMELGNIKDILGQEINYDGDVVRVTGNGTMVDDYKIDVARSNKKQSRLKIYEQSIDIPLPAN